MPISVIITTYNAPAWLQKSVWGWAAQTDRDFDLVIADDGSTDETRQMIEALRQETGLTIHHVWQEDQGFRKCEILNKAIVASGGDYLILSDGDCVPRGDFVAVHRRLARPNRFLSGGYVKLPLELSEKLTLEDIASGRPFDVSWLREQGVELESKALLLWPQGRVAHLFDSLTPTRPTWNGHNSSALKSDLVAVNGFNEEMQYGGLDRELGERMENNGTRGVQIRHQAICVHLEHGRGYMSKETWQKNRTIRQRVVKERLKWAERGIVKQEA